MRSILPIVFLATSQLAGASPAVETDFPQADPKAIVVSGNARFTILTPAMVRMEWSATAAFEDRASLAFINRRLDVPHFTTESKGGWLNIETDELSLRYREGVERFTSRTLTIDLKQPKPVRWIPGTVDKENLLGTTRTLDSISGAAPLESGLLSRSGWSLVDDSTRPLFTSTDWRASEWPWAVPRPSKEIQDWYFLGYGHDYTRALKDFTRVSGRIPLPPRYVFGSWWSRYWPLADTDFKAILAGFREHGIPLDVMVIDMDWHLPGWTGYTWNPKYFPDPDGFMKWLHGEGLRTTLNLHPADGVKSHEKAYPEVAKAMGFDPHTTETVKFNCADPKFIDAYFKYLHHPLEKQGVDFWWMDWQQQKETPIAGLDPLFWLNYLHWNDRVRSGDRPLIFSRWGGLGNHRYQIGFSGDTYCDWKSLAFQPYFTSTAANVGYGYWSHDIGGHQPGITEPELYARWLQWGAFNPILRTHCTANPLSERRIWKFPPEVYEVGKAAYKLRYELIPYIYTAARQAYDTGVSLCRPLYYTWPEIEESYNHPGEYMFGDDLLVSPVVEPINPTSRCASSRVWLPPGEWTNWFTGVTTKGPVAVDLMVPLDEIPLFVRGGAIIPTAPEMRSSAEKPLDPLILNVWPGESGRLRLYEDDGLGAAYQSDSCSWLSVTNHVAGGKREIEIAAVEGTFPGMLKERSYEVRIHDTLAPRQVLLDNQAVELSYDADSFVATIRIPKRSTAQATHLTIVESDKSLQPIRDGLRGRRKTYKDVSSLLGMSYTEALLENPAPLFDAIDPEDAQSTQTLAALTRLLGFSYSMKSEALDGGRLKVTARANMLAADEKLEGRFTLSKVPGWRVADRSLDVPITEWPASATWILSPDGEQGPARVSASVSFVRAGKPFQFPLDAWLLPSINAWWVVGPWDNPWDKKLDQVLPPEQSLDLKATYVGKSGEKISWKKIERATKAGDDVGTEFFVDLNKLFGRDYEYTVAYAVTYLHAPKAMDVTLAVGSDDGNAIWLNGREVHRNPAGRPYLSRQDRVPVHLNEGTNTLLLKISQGTAGWGFCVHVETAGGQPIPGVRATLSP